MKKILLLCCFLTAYSIVNAQKGIEININTGIPITRIDKSFDLHSMYIEGGIQKTVFRNLFWGLGINYSSIDIKPSSASLTYDRNTSSYYTFFGNSFYSKNKKTDFSPQVKVGYSTYTYSMNEYGSGKDSDNGFFIAPGIVVKHKLNNKWYLSANAFYDVIFNSYNMGPDVFLPLNFSTVQDKTIKDFSIGIGLTYKVN